MTEFEPRSNRELLMLVDMIKTALKSQRTPEGMLNPSGIKIIAAVVEALEVKLGGERRGPAIVPGSKD